MRPRLRHRNHHDRLSKDAAVRAVPYRLGHRDASPAMPDEADFAPTVGADGNAGLGIARTKLGTVDFSSEPSYWIKAPLSVAER